jgi:hypothetical protein
MNVREGREKKGTKTGNQESERQWEKKEEAKKI